MYDKVQELGILLRDSQPTYDDIGNYFAPKSLLSKDTQSGLEVRIKSLCQRSNKYLDQCGMRMPKPLWHYDRKNPETHKSAPQFKYAHLIS